MVGFSGGNKYLFPGRERAGGAEFFSLAGRGGDESDDHRQQVDAGAQGRGSRGRHGRRAEALLLHGGGAGASWPAFSPARRKALGTRRANSRSGCTSHTRSARSTPSSRCAPPMYDELWVGGKCMYKLEPVVADGGELIIYAPHIHEISLTHGQLIRRGRLPLPRLLPEAVGAVQGRTRGARWRIPRTCAASGTYEDGVEQCRIQVTLATGIPRGGLRGGQSRLPRSGDHRSGGVSPIARTKACCSSRKPARCSTTSSERPEWAREM